MTRHIASFHSLETRSNTTCAMAEILAVGDWESILLSKLFSDVGYAATPQQQVSS